MEAVYLFETGASVNASAALQAALEVERKK